MCILLLCGVVSKCQLDPVDLLINGVMSSSISLLIFCVVMLSTVKNGTLKSPPVIVDLHISPFSSISFWVFSTYFVALLFAAVTFRTAISSW